MYRTLPTANRSNSPSFTTGVLANTSPDAIATCTQRGTSETRTRQKNGQPTCTTTIKRQQGQQQVPARTTTTTAKTTTQQTTSASPTPASQGLPSFFFFVGSLAAQHRRLPNGGGQQQAQRRRAQKWWLAAPRERRTSRPPGGEGGRRHTLPAKEGQALAPPGLPIAQRQHTSAWQRWKKQRRKTASTRSGLVRGPALTEGKRLETRGTKVRPSLLTATHHNVEFSSAPRGVRVVTLSSPPCNTAQGALPPVSHSDWLTSVKWGFRSPLRGSFPCGEAYT